MQSNISTRRSSWFAVAAAVCAIAHLADVAALGSDCAARNGRLRTVANRMINIKSSFRRGAHEVDFVRTATLRECNELCCSEDECDTVMYIGPKAAVWRTHRGPVSNKGNCALLACGGRCVVDTLRLHHGIYISKLASQDSFTSEAPTTSEATLTLLTLSPTTELTVAELGEVL